MTRLQVVPLLYEGIARKMRIQMTLTVAHRELNEAFGLEEELVRRIASAEPGKVWPQEQNDLFDAAVNELGGRFLAIVKAEVATAAAVGATM